MPSKSSKPLSNFSPSDLDDDEMLELEDLLQEEMYDKSYNKLHPFFVNFWNCHDPSRLHTSWVQECIAEHVEAAMNRQIRRLTIQVPPRCLPRTTQVLMHDGSYKALGTIEVGQQVKSSNGSYITDEIVTHVIEAGTKECLKFTFNDGSSLITSKEHNIKTPSGFTQAQDLQPSDVVYSHINQKNSKPVGVSLDDAFLLGCWVAEGTKGERRSFKISNATPGIVSKLKTICGTKGWQYRSCKYSPTVAHRWINPRNSKGNIQSWFTTFIDKGTSTICYDSVVPSCIFKASDEVKIEFLNAFIACDGWIDSYSGKIGTELSSKQLAIDVHRLFKQLGFYSTLKTRPSRGSFINPRGITCNSREHYSCTLSRGVDIERAKLVFNFYHKQDTLTALPVKTIKRDADIPLKLLSFYTELPTNLQQSQKCASIPRINRELSKRSQTAIQPVIDSYNADLRWKSITKIEDAGNLPCMDLTVTNHHTFFADDILVSNSGKSLMSVSSICWQWLRCPWEKFWLVSHSEKLYMQNIVLSRRLMTHPQYASRWMNAKHQERFKFSLAKDVNTKTRVENDQGGYILGGSPSSKALGVGYNVAFLDDVLDSEQANSPDAVQKVNEWYTQTFLNRSNDVNTDVQIIFMQRLNQNDIINYVNTTYGDQGWFNLVLPAKYDRKRIFTSPIGFNDKRIHQNQLLDPVRLPDSFLAAQAKNPIIYNTRYQQNPGAGGEGNLVKAEWLHQENTLPSVYDQMITVWDLSFGDAPTASYSVGLVLGSRNGNYYIVDMIRKRMAVPEQVDSIREFKAKYPSSQVAVEKRANGNAAISLLEREIHNIYAFQPRLFGGSKEQRLSAVLPYMRDKLVHVYAPFEVDTSVHNDYDADLIIAELLAFPLGTHNDIVDCVAYGLQWLAQYGQETTAMVTKGLEIIIPEAGLSNDIKLRYDPAELISHETDYDYSIFGDIMSKDYISNLF